MLYAMRTLFTTLGDRTATLAGCFTALIAGKHRKMSAVYTLLFLKEVEGPKDVHVLTSCYHQYNI